MIGSSLRETKRREETVSKDNSFSGFFPPEGIKRIMALVGQKSGPNSLLKVGAKSIFLC